MPSGCPGAVGSTHLIVPPYLAASFEETEDMAGAVPGPVAVDEVLAVGFVLTVVVFEMAADVAGAAEVVTLEVVVAADEVEEVELLHPVITKQQTKRITRGMRTFFILPYLLLLLIR
jgi:hypothetical protein